MPLHITHNTFTCPRLRQWVLSLLLAASTMHGVGKQAAHATEDLPVEVYKAGTIWPGYGPAIHDAVMLVQGGKVLAVGPRASMEIPAAAIEHDLGGQTVIPGLVIAQSALVESSNDSEYTVTPEVRAIDGFDPFADYKQWIEAGVTTVQLSAGSQRLMPGQGAVVKLAGEDPTQQVLVESESLRILLTSGALSPPTIYEPPVGAVSVDRPLEPTRPQLATSLAQAIVGLDALFATATAAESDDSSLGALAAAIEAKRTFRFTVENGAEIKAAYALATKFNLRWLLVDPVDTQELSGVDWKSEQAVGVIFNPEFRPGRITNPSIPVPGLKRPLDVWQRAAALVAAGAADKLAIRPSVDADIGNLLFLSSIFQRGGLSSEQVLRMLTANPASMLGIGDRVGSLQPGLDADFVVLSGQPFASGARVTATYINGLPAYSTDIKPTASVIEVAQVYTPAGVIEGGVSVANGKIVGVGSSLSTPRNANLRRFPNAVIVPGWIDCGTALGIGGTLADQLSLETKLGPLLARDDDQMAVARQGGVTSALLSSSRFPSPVLAFKLTDQPRPLMDPVAVRFEVSGNLTATEASTRQLLARGKAYADVWNKYDADFAEYQKKLKEYEAEKLKYDEAVKAAAAKQEAEKKEAEKNAAEQKPAENAGKPDTGKEDAEKKTADASSTKAGEPAKSDASADIKAADSNQPVEPKKPDEPKKPTAIPALEPYRPLFAKTIAALVEASDPRAVEVVVKLFREEFDLHTALVSNSAAVANAELLAKHKVLVIVGPNLIEVKDGKPLNIPAELSVANVALAFQSSSTTGASLLPDVLAFGVYDGLGRSDAIKGMSSGPAAFFKLNSIGAIEVGRDADLVVLSGPPFEIASEVLAVMIDGRWVYEKESK